MRSAILGVLFTCSLAVGTDHLASQTSIDGSVVVIVLDDIGIEWLGMYQDATDPTGLGDLPPTGSYPDVPAIKEIKDHGIKFKHGWATPWCSSTRTVMNTGSFSFRTGIGKQIIPLNNPMNPDPTTIFPRDPVDLSPLSLGRLAKEAGYQTGCFGKWHMSGSERFGALPTSTAYQAVENIVNPNKFAFDRFFGHLFQVEGICDWRGYKAIASPLSVAPQLFGTFGTIGSESYFLCEVLDEMARDTNAWIRTRTSPFLCWFAPLAPYESLYHPPNPPQVPNPACNTCGITFHNETFAVTLPGALAVEDEKFLAFHALIEAADASVRALLDALDAVAEAEQPGTRWYDKVTVILVGDNGTPDGANWYWSDGQVKGEVNEGGVRVPFIIGGKGVPVTSGLRGTTSSYPVMVADIFWTVDALIGANTSLGLKDGSNLQPVLQNLFTGPRMIYTERFSDNFAPTTPAIPPVIATGAGVREWQRAATDGTYKVIHRGVHSQLEGWQWSTSTLTYGIDDKFRLNEWPSTRNANHDALDAFVGNITTVFVP